jgi:hypothetical protein
MQERKREGLKIMILMEARVKTDTGCAKKWKGKKGKVIQCEERCDGYYYTLQFESGFSLSRVNFHEDDLVILENL